MTPEEIFKDYSEELKTVERRLADIFKSDIPLIPAIGGHILQSGGKRIRPLFLLMSADLCGYKGEERQLLAAIIEAIHTASLLHDDVIDGAKTRRGRPAAHTLWGNQAVVLVGDFLYSNALRLVVMQRSQEIMEALSEASTRMTEGEILQLQKTADPEISREEYFKIISSKTGVLISAACGIGGILAKETDERVTALGSFGLKIGIAFQLADDILDYVAKQKDLGKKLGKDIEEGKITMPLIYLLQATADKDRDEIKKIIKGHGSRVKGLERIMDLFSKYNAVEESFKIARSLVNEAKNELNVFPPSKEKETIITMAEYVMAREK